MRTTDWSRLNIDRNSSAATVSERPRKKQASSRAKDRDRRPSQEGVLGLGPRRMLEDADWNRGTSSEFGWFLRPDMSLGWQRKITASRAAGCEALRVPSCAPLSLPVSGCLQSVLRVVDFVDLKALSSFAKAFISPFFPPFLVRGTWAYEFLCGCSGSQRSLSEGQKGARDVRCSS